MRNFLAVFIGLILLCAGAQAEPKATQFWNLTSATVTELRLAPAGSGQFGENLCLHDKDKNVDHDERLKITGLNSGRYDAKIAYANGRSCLVKDLAIEAGKVFSIEDKDLTACTISSHGDD